MIENTSNRIMVLVSGLVIILLGLVLAGVVYSLFKPPVVTKATIDSLIRSTEMTQTYVKEMRDLAVASAQQTREDNQLRDQMNKGNDTNYKDLKSKYGIIDYESRKDRYANVSNNEFTGPIGLHPEAKVVRRQ